MKKFTFVFLFLAIVLAACGGQQAEPVAEIDVANLPASVDVSTTHELMSNPDVLLIDVREQWEYDEGHIPGITLIPMGDVPNRLSEIPTDKEVIVTCRSGNRSGQITDYLDQQGFTNVHNMEGGIVAWQQAGFEVEQ
ncbi:MAG: rhodanese-like domain-containing protein [Chloroflexi bacterium]|nr:rhodanese-like domain-containing protein [Chloroflexota bacterium]